MERLLRAIKTKLPENINELRLGINNNLVYKIGNKTFETDEIVTSDLLKDLLKVATADSLYAVGEYLSDGYLAYGNGIRIGLAGVYTLEDRKPKTIKKISGLVIRIPREIIGCSKVIQRKYFDKNILVVSKPYSGKTTFLRDLARRISLERQVVIIDEREEIYGGGKMDLGKSLVIYNLLQSFCQFYRQLLEY